MNRKHIAWILGIAAVAIVLLSWWSAAPVAAGPSKQINTPRPTLTPTPLPPGPAARLHGGILDWGKGYMPEDVRVSLKGDGWEIFAETDEWGQYYFRAIGNEIAVLNVIAPANRPELRPLASDLPVKVRVDGELIVNMALYPQGADVKPIVTLKMVSSATEAKPGKNVSFIITVENGWNDWANDVIVGDMLPSGLEYVSATVSQGQIIYEKGLVWATLGPVAAGSSATVTVMAKVKDDAVPEETIVNKAAVYYRENVAVEAHASVKVVKETNGVLPVTGVATVLPVAGLLLAGALVGIRRLRSMAK